MRLRRWSKWLTYDAVLILAAILLFSAVNCFPQISNLPPDISKISTSQGAVTCVVIPHRIDVYDATERRGYERIEVDAVGTATYADSKTPPFKVLLSTRKAEITGENVVEETMALSSRECVRWVTTVNRLVSESATKETRRKK
jgi:hypothetical protein